MNKNDLYNEYDFIAQAEERETQINFDIYGQKISVYTSHNGTARRLHKRLGYPTLKNELGAEWVLPMNQCSRIPIGTFKFIRQADKNKDVNNNGDIY